MPKFTDEEIRKLCAQVAAAKSEDDLSSTLPQLQDAIREHISLAGDSLGALKDLLLLQGKEVIMANTKLDAKVEKIIASNDPAEPEKAEISVENADPLYRELRIENKLQDEAGHVVTLKPGAHVELTLTADSDDTLPPKS